MILSDILFKPLFNVKTLGVVLILSLSIGCYTLYNSNKSKAAKIDEYVAQVAAYEKSIKDLQQYSSALESNRNTLQEELKKNSDEINDLRNKLKSNTTKLYIKASCPTTQTEAPNTNRNEAAVAQLNGEAEQSYLGLRQAIEDTTSVCEYFRKSYFDLYEYIWGKDK